MLEDLLGTEKQFYAALQKSWFAGSFNSQAVPPAKYHQYPVAWFAAQALYQHIPAYVAQITPELLQFFDPQVLTPADCEKLLRNQEAVRRAMSTADVAAQKIAAMAEAATELRNSET